MRSKRGVLAAAVLLLSVPITVLASNVLGIDDEVVIHVCFATGFALFAFAVFDFTTARWIAWAGSLSMAALAVIFYAQGVSKAVYNETLHTVAFDILGQELESALVDVFVLWCLAVLLSDSQGMTRLFGWLAISLIVSVELYGYGLMLVGDEAPEILKLSFVLPIVWLLLESRQSRDSQAEQQPAVLAPSP